MLSSEYPPNMVGGLGQHVDNLAPALAARGVDVHVVTPRDRGGESVEIPSAGVTIYRVDTPPRTGELLMDTQLANRELARVAEVLAESLGGFDLIHAHDWLVAYAAVRLKHQWKLPLVATIHATERGRCGGYLSTDLSRAINRVEDDLASEGWRVIVTSYYMAHELITFFGEPNDKVDVIPNAVTVADFARQPATAVATLRRRYATDDERVVFYVGRLVWEKGLHVLLEAAPRILAEARKVRFVLAGRGPMLDDLRIQRDRLGLGQAVQFAGFVSDADKRLLYQAANVAAFPSLYEPFGIVALEAMAAQAPVVVSSVGGLSEVVENHVTGMTSQPGDPDSLAWSIVHTLNRPDWAAARVENAYRRLVDNFNWERVATRTREVYDRVLEERRQTDW